MNKLMSKEEVDLEFLNVRKTFPQLFDMLERTGQNCPRCNFPLLRPHVLSIETGNKVSGACIHCGYKEVVSHKRQNISLEARKNKAYGYLRKNSIDLPKGFKQRILSRYQINNDEMNQAVSNCRRIGKEVANGRAIHAMLMGSTGVGKTFLACAICNYAEMVNSFRSKILYISVPILAEMRDSSIRDELAGKRLSNVMFEVPKADLVVLDDLGTERNTDWGKEMINQIIEKREDKAILITTNLKNDEGERPLDRYSSRTRSRIKYHMNHDDCIVFNETPDYRCRLS